MSEETEKMVRLTQSAAAIGRLGREQGMSEDTEKLMRIARLVREYGHVRRGMLALSQFEWFDRETVLAIDRQLRLAIADALIKEELGDDEC